MCRWKKPYKVDKKDPGDSASTGMLAKEGGGSRKKRNLKGHQSEIPLTHTDPVVLFTTMTNMQTSLESLDCLKIRWPHNGLDARLTCLWIFLFCRLQRS